MDTNFDRPIRIGLVDDDPIFSEHTTNMLDLRVDMTAFRFESYSEIEKAIKTDELDCIVVDYNLGGDNGLNLHLNLSSRYAKLPPLILISGAGDEKTVVRAFRNGFSDYVSKRQFNIDELCASVRRVVAKARTTRAEAFSPAHQSVDRDSDDHTGLYSSSFLRRRIDELLADPRRRPFAIIGIRISRMKEIRAEIGHVRSERVRHEFACALKRVSDTLDIAGGWQDDEWMVLLDGVPSKLRIDETAARLSEALALRTEVSGLVVDLHPEIRVAGFPDAASDLASLMAIAFPNSDGVSNPERSSVSNGSNWLDPDAASIESASSSCVSSFQERRRERRRRVMKRGQIIHGNHDLSVMCNIRDQSSRGARLRLDSWIAAPKTLELRIVGSGFKQRAALRWQKGLDVGIEFEEEMP
ncbi:Diguanylate cyclase, GGDEF domain [Fulvimarina manganoxydans]|uniref:Diguanylate cyclase, GGDEF domain n=2 Tax=Fulvimarina manganoxydans TaxID=937218 RepID=A0A1W2ER41_9HYPH|nr:Diguanylate cyclase, GGDEF domain [Fulvimarina manganoxydans]